MTSDNQPPWPENAGLLEAMRKGQQRGDGHFKPFFEMLQQARLIIPLNEPPSFQQEGNFSLSPFYLRVEGELAPVAFTDKDSYQKAFNEKTYMVVAPSQDVCRVLLDAGKRQLLLNPQGSTSYLMSSHEMIALAQSFVPTDTHRIEVQRETPVRIERLHDELKPDMKTAIRKLCVQNGIEELWWSGIAFGGEPPHHCLAIAPLSQEMMKRIGPQIESAWRRLQAPEAPQNALLYDVLNLASIEPLIQKDGERVFPE